MINLYSWKTWIVLAVTLILVTLLLYWVYVADVKASEKVVVTHPAPKLGVEETEKQCLQQLQAKIPGLVNDPSLAGGAPAIDFQGVQVPVLITPTRYGYLNLEGLVPLLNSAAGDFLTACARDTGGYELEKDVHTAIEPTGIISLNLHYIFKWEKKAVKESRTPLYIYANIQHLGGFIRDYVDAQRMLPAIHKTLLESLAQKYDVAVELYGLGDTVVYKVQESSQDPVPIYFAAQYPWQKPVLGARLLNKDQIGSTGNVHFSQGSYWIIAEK